MITGAGDGGVRIVQGTTGKVGGRLFKGVIRRPGLELVGCDARSEDQSDYGTGQVVRAPDNGQPDKRGS